MTEPIESDQLKAEFRLLRETEARAAPEYSKLLAGTRTAQPTQRWRPPARLTLAATAASVAALAIVITVSSGRNDGLNDQGSEWTSDSAQNLPPAIPQAELIASFDMPTDFLLDTPWFELARTTPDFNLDIPQYDFPEEPSDEI